MGLLYQPGGDVLPATAVVDLWDFDASTNNKNLFGNRAINGGTISINPTIDNARFGAHAVNTGVNPAGVGSYERAFTQIFLTSPLWLWSAGIQLSAVASVAQDYVARVGLSDTATADFANGVYWEYNRAVSPFWQFCTAIAGVRVRTVSLFAATTDWVNFIIQGSPGGVLFSSNNITAGRVTSFPSAVLGRVLMIEKTAGTTSVSLTVDYEVFGYIPDNAH